MRLQELSIKNFRSLKDAKLSLLDLGIATLIGPNGSGKSNILKAIAALAAKPDIPTDDDFFAADDDDDRIELAGTFVFEDRDQRALTAFGLAPCKFERVRVVVEKKRGQESVITYEATVAAENGRAAVSQYLRELQSIASRLTLNPSYGQSKDELLAKVRQAVESLGNLDEETVIGVEKVFLGLHFSSAPVVEEFNKKIEQIRRALRHDYGAAFERIFSGLAVEMLQLGTYEIENVAPIDELDERQAHPFLFDLLQLAEKKASAFGGNSAPALSRTKDAASQKLSRAVSSVWPSHDLRFQIDRHDDKLAFMVFTPQGRQISLTDLSDGEQWFLKFYVRLAIAQKEGRQVLWLFDEPGRDLHSASQIDLKAFFETICGDAQIIYTSHLAMMIPWHRLERIFAVENGKADGTVIHNRFWKDTNLSSPLRQALSTFVGEELIAGREHVIVEGISDYFYFQGWVRHFQNNPTPSANVKCYGLSKRVMVPVDGIEKIPLYCWFLGRKIKKRVNWVVVVDSAGDSTKTSKNMTEAGLGTWTKNITSVGELCAEMAGPEEIEGVFEASEYIERFHCYYQARYPKCDLPSRDEILAGHDKNAKLTKVIEALLRQKNPDIRTKEGQRLALDKTGIAQHVYSELVQKGAVGFSKETEARFASILDGIDRTFSHNVDE